MILLLESWDLHGFINFADNLTEALLFLSHFMGDIHQVYIHRQFRCCTSYDLSFIIIQWVSSCFYSQCMLDSLVMKEETPLNCDGSGTNLIFTMWVPSINDHPWSLSLWCILQWQFSCTDNIAGQCPFSFSFFLWMTEVEFSYLGMGQGDYSYSSKGFLWQWHGSLARSHRGELHWCKTTCLFTSSSCIH